MYIQGNAAAENQPRAAEMISGDWGFGLGI